MHCPFCNTPDTKVVDSRAARDGLGIRRRRRCLQCDRRFSTSERLDAELSVAKRSGRSEAFDRSKLAASLRRACTKDSCDEAEIERMVARIEAELAGCRTQEVRSTKIGDLALRELAAVDRLACARFATVYRRLADWPALRAELEPMLAPGKE